MSLPPANEFMGALMLLGGIFAALMVIGFVIEFWPVILVGLGLMFVISLCRK